MRLLTKNYALGVICILLGSTSLSQTPVKRVLVEESTGTWCASCGYGGIYFEHLETNYPNAIPVAVHTGPGGQDPMAVLSLELYMLDYFSGSPTFLFDRKDFPSNPNTKPSVSASNPWENGLDTLDSYLDMVYNQSPLATVGITQSFDSGTRELSVTVTANFIQNTTGEFRLNCLVVEDSVTGGSEYDQANSNFSGWTSGPAYLQYLIDAPAVIPNYVHNHVLREALGNMEGQSASIPTTVTAGSSYSKTFAYTLPTDYDENNIKLVGLVQRYGSDKINDREIVNANSVSLLGGTASIQNEEAIGKKIRFYPNPLNQGTDLEFYIPESGHVSCTLYNLQGQKLEVLFDQHLVQGEYRKSLNSLNLSKGTYILVLQQNGIFTREKLILE